MKYRLDELLVKKGLCKNLKIANSFIMQNKVKVDGSIENKAGINIDENADIILDVKSEKYVSRGAYKLKKAIELFDIDLTDKIVVDIGSSTGGFTDLILQNNAKKVYAIDVGYGQLDYKLRKDTRVKVMERFNARYLKKSDLEDEIDFISTDVSFISLKLLTIVISDILKESGSGVALIKPQFEADYEDVDSGGIINDKTVHIKVLEDIVNDFKTKNLNPLAITHSPITGAEGNIEFLIYYDKTKDDLEFDYEEIVNSAYKGLKRR